MLITLILRFIHFVGLSPNKNTSRTISRTPAGFSHNQACTCYRVRSRLLYSHDGRPKPYSAAEGLMKYSVSRGPWRSFYTFMTTAKPPGASWFQDTPGGLPIQNWV